MTKNLIRLMKKLNITKSWMHKLWSINRLDVTVKARFN